MGCFITFEGPEGGGKTTQLALLHHHLEQVGYDVLALREPGSTVIGDQIRKILHDPTNTEMSPVAELLLYSAARAQLVRETVSPALRAGRIVLCDRYAESTLAYQGYGHELKLSLLQAVSDLTTEGLRPDMIIYLDITPEQGLQRKRKAFRAGTGEWNRMDQQAVEFHQRVRAGYLEMASREPQRWLQLDATRETDGLRRDILRQVGTLLAARGIQPILHPDDQ
jgi:dTMP kinase